MSPPSVEKISSAIRDVFGPESIVQVYEGDSKLSPEGSGTSFIEVHDVAPWPGSTGAHRRVVSVLVFADVVESPIVV